ncbi:hypothetical protein K461DRAFT_139711 [Myriangium duriaei CBS 260.36]|uniref:Uncharacterized protein n=1 Tax=Myriangium duriaei CBS 260.36 TaxID=1168546 RepID=A0A9P4MHP7_9PEZI|nr:hypothetical protein K461DRAFT_139711 [Myriangium duriaei CBS 260.36]
MHESPSHLLAQTPLTVSPFITLPVPPTLPHNYTTLPSTLPASVLSTTDSDQKPAYVLSAQGFSAHPSAIKAQNLALLGQLSTAGPEAQRKVEEWERDIGERELREKRRRAPGWLDREEKILRPEQREERRQAEQPKVDLLGDEDTGEGKEVGGKRDEVGELMDKAFG